MGASNFFKTKDNIEVDKVLQDLGADTFLMKSDNSIAIVGGKFDWNDEMKVVFRNGKCLGAVDLLDEYSSVAEWLIETDQVDMDNPVDTMTLDEYIQSMLLEDSYFVYNEPNGFGIAITKYDIKAVDLKLELETFAKKSIEEHKEA